MSTSLTRSSLRQDPFGFTGTFATQIVSSVIVSVAYLTQRSVSERQLPVVARTLIAQRDVGGLFTAFLLVSVYLSLLVIAVTTTTGLKRQSPSIALVRCVGATPGQVRRAVALQNAGLAVVGASIGGAAGVALAPPWLGLLQHHAVVPAAVQPAGGVGGVAIALAVMVPTSILAGLVAAVRASRRSPTAVLTRITSGRSGPPWFRSALGLGVVGGAIALSVLVSRRAPQEAGDAAALVLLGGCVGVGLLAPALVRGVAGVPFLRLAGRAGSVARDTVRVHCAALSAPLVPLALGIGFVLVKVGAHATAARTGAPEDPPAVWLDLTGTGVYVAFALLAAVAALFAATASRRGELHRLRLAGATPATVTVMAALEGVVVGAAACLGGGSVAALTLVPLVRGVVGTAWPTVPGAVIGAVIAATLTLTVGGSALAARLSLRRRDSAQGVA